MHYISLSLPLLTLHVANPLSAFDLNLHGRGLHVREDPPVLLWAFTHLLHIQTPTSISNGFILSKLNSQSTTTLANISKHQSTITFARTRVKALLRVVLFVPARITTLAHSTTPLGPLIMGIFSSINSFMRSWMELKRRSL